MPHQNDHEHDADGLDATSVGASSTAPWLQLIDALEQQLDVESFEALLTAMSDSATHAAPLPDSREQAIANALSARVVERIGLATDAVPKKLAESIAERMQGNVAGLLCRFVPFRSLAVAQLVPSAALDAQPSTSLDAMTFDLADYFGREVVDRHLAFAGSRVTLTRVRATTEATYFAALEARADAPALGGRGGVLLITIADMNGRVASVRLTADVGGGVLDGALAATWQELTGATFVLE